MNFDLITFARQTIIQWEIELGRNHSTICQAVKPSRERQRDGVADSEGNATVAVVAR